MLIMLLIFSRLTFAQEDMSAERYCFATEAEAQSIESKFNGIKVPSDNVARDQKCMTVQMRPHRRELIQRFVLSVAPHAKVEFSSEESRKDPCQIKVEKEKSKVMKAVTYNLDGRPIVSADDQTSASTDTMYIQTLKEFNLTVDQDEVNGQCRYITQNKYEITLEVRKNLKPIFPGTLPPGTILVGVQPPPNQETMVLKTQLQLNRGDRVEIGSVIKDLKNKDRKVDINPTLKVENTDGAATELVYLSLQ